MASRLQPTARKAGTKVTKSNSSVQLLGASLIAAVIMLVYFRAPIFPVALGTIVAVALIERRRRKTAQRDSSS
jgi:hypothetical protein